MFFDQIPNSNQDKISFSLENEIFFEQNISKKYYSVLSEEDYEEIYKNKTVTEKENNSNSPHSSTTIISNNIKRKSKRKSKYKSIDEFKTMKKIRNREAARKSRARKKENLKNLFEENQRLKHEIIFLQTQLKQTLCQKCKEKIKKESEAYITHQNSQSKTTAFLFTTFIVLLCIIGNLYYMEFFDNKGQKLRNLLRDSLEKETFYKDVKTLTNLQKDPFVLTEKDLEDIHVQVESLHVSFGDYFAITKEDHFLNSRSYTFQNKGKIRILKEFEANLCNDSNTDYCLIELNKTNLMKHESEPFQFRLYMHKNKFWKNDYDEKGKPFVEINKSFSEESFIELNCLIIGASINSVRKT